MSEPSPQRLAPGIALGLTASLVAALRVTYQGPLSALVLLFAAVSVVVVPVGLWLRRSSLKDPTSADRALLEGVALSSLPLALFGGVLKSTTHHRPLGGATFAVVACVVLVLCIGIGRRIGSSAVKAPWLKQFFSVCCALSLFSTLALLAGEARLLLDFLVLSAACAAAGLSKIPKVVARVPGLVWTVVWTALLGGSLFLTRSPGAMRELERRAPISFAALSWLGDGS